MMAGLFSGLAEGTGILILNGDDLKGNGHLALRDKIIPILEN